MAYKPFSIDGLLSSGGNDVVRAALNTGSPNNERIVIKRIRILNVLADGGATATVDLWKGPTRNDANREIRSLKLDPGQKWEADPTFMILEPGETLWFAATPAGSCSISADGAFQNE